MSGGKKTVINKYFAAANGYNGFASRFDEVFPSGAFDRIFILKGGPGTGKSSLMKKTAKELSEYGCKIDEIYCSSDPHSLDGIIARSGEKSIAIIDGTAPHERDAKIPGAEDEIINLGDNWDSRFLTSQREDIFELSKEKSRAYATAYSYLGIAGKCAKFIFSVSEKIFDKNEAKIKAESMFEKIEPLQQGEGGSVLISSFGRYGHHRIEGINAISNRTIGVSGNQFSATIFFDFLHYFLRDKGYEFINFPSPLDLRHSDGIFIPGPDVLFIHSLTGEINADELTERSTDSECIRQAISMHRDALEEAKRWFSIASDLHFRLEGIYSGAMNFAKNDEILSKKLAEMKNILEISR